MRIRRTLSIFLPVLLLAVAALPARALDTSSTATALVTVTESVECGLLWQSNTLSFITYITWPGTTQSDTLVLSCTYNTGQTTFRLDGVVTKTSGAAWVSNINLDAGGGVVFWTDSDFGTSKSLNVQPSGNNTFLHNINVNINTDGFQAPGDYAFEFQIVVTKI